MILPGIMKIMQKISEICRTRKIIAVTVLPHNRKLRWKKINTNSITTATPSSSNSGVWGIEPASSSISKKKGIVRGAEYFR